MRRTFLLSAGWFFIVLGTIIAPLPGPGGTPVIAFGVIILLNNSRWARRHFVKLSHRYPAIVGRFRLWLQRRSRTAATPTDDAARIGVPIRGRTTEIET